MAFRRTQTAVGSPTGITMGGMAMTLTSGQMTDRERQGFKQDHNAPPILESFKLFQFKAAKGQTKRKYNKHSSLHLQEH